MIRTDKLKVMFRNRAVGTLSLTPDSRLNVFEYDKAWLGGRGSISPLELPLKPGAFIAKPQPFRGDFGIFEDSKPDRYGRKKDGSTIILSRKEAIEGKDPDIHTLRNHIRDYISSGTLRRETSSFTGKFPV